VLSVLEEKANGGEIRAATGPARQPAQVIDLMEALKKSLGAEPARHKAAATRTKRRSRESRETD
jgi:non-homologous end joining protein Ku